MFRALSAIVGLLTLTVLTSTQALSFDVASIKPNPAARGSRFLIQPGGRLVATAQPAVELIRRAYGVRSFNIEGLPDWAKQERFDVQAKAAESDAPVDDAQVLAMLRHLLTDRFALRAHGETQVRPVFFLERERSDHPLSHGFQESTADCTNKRPDSIGTPSPGCGVMTRSTNAGGVAAVVIQFQGRRMAEFAGDLELRAGRTILDRTGIDGQFDVSLEVLAGQSQDVSVFTALREQLGLRLVPHEAPVEILIVDSIARPSPD